ncbi:MAG: GNAT family N-acetyltransferase [Caldilineaceae bacterium]
MSITIRKAVVSDAAAIVRLNEAHNDLRSSETEIAKRLVKTDGIETLYLAEIDNYAVGFLCLCLRDQICDDATYAEVSELFVDAEYRRRGVAHALMEQAATLAKQAGAREVILMTNFRNHVAQQFYFAHGFENYCIALRRRL